MKTWPYSLPAPSSPHERRAFSARNSDGRERVWHATAAQGMWEVDYEDWWIYEGGWITVDDAEIIHPRRRTNPNPRRQ